MATTVYRLSGDWHTCQTVDVAMADPDHLVVAWRNNGRADKTDMGSILCARSADGGATWSEADVLARHDERRAYGNVILYGEGGTIHAFVGEMPMTEPNSENQRLTLALRSPDGGRSWTEEPLRVRYPHPTITGGRIVRHDGRYLMPFHRNDDRDPAKRLHGVLTSPDLRDWDLLSVVPNPDGVFLQEGFLTAAQGAPETLLIVMRTDVGYVYAAESADGGRSWTDARREVAIPNHNVKGFFAKDARDQYVALFNTARDRAILHHRTKPDGRPWTVSRPLAAGTGWNCYAMLLEYAPSRFYAVWERDRSEIVFDTLDLSGEPETA